MQNTDVQDWLILHKVEARIFNNFFVCLKALSDCVKDLLKPFQNESIDIVAGIDAMGFILGKLQGVQSSVTEAASGEVCVCTHTGGFILSCSSYSDAGRNLTHRETN